MEAGWVEVPLGATEAAVGTGEEGSEERQVAEMEGRRAGLEATALEAGWLEASSGATEAAVWTGEDGSEERQVAEGRRTGLEATEAGRSGSPRWSRPRFGSAAVQAARQARWRAL